MIGDLAMIGKEIRLERIIDRNSGKTVIVPMDHGVTVGPIEGLEDMRSQKLWLAAQTPSLCTKE